MRPKEEPLLSPKEITQHRWMLKLTQRQLAERLCVSYRAIENYEQPVGRKNHRQMPNSLAKILMRWCRDGLPY